MEYNIVLQNSNYGRYLYMGGTVNMEGIYIWEELQIWEVSIYGRNCKYGRKGFVHGDTPIQ